MKVYRLPLEPGQLSKLGYNKKVTVWNPKGSGFKEMKQGWVSHQDDLGNFWVPLAYIKTKRVHAWIKERVLKLNRVRGTLTLVIRAADDEYVEFGMFWEGSKIDFEEVVPENYSGHYCGIIDSFKYFPTEIKI